VCSGWRRCGPAQSAIRVAEPHLILDSAIPGWLPGWLPVAPPCGENFLYVFKGARSAPRALRRVAAHTASAGELAHTARSGRDAPAGTRSIRRRPLALPRQRTAAAAEARTPGSSPHRLSAAARRACANGAILPARPLLKPSKITVKARLCTQANRYRRRRPGARTREADLDGDLPSFQLGAGRKDGQVWSGPPSVARRYNHRGSSLRYRSSPQLRIYRKVGLCHG
jgi:hypothetical protein